MQTIVARAWSLSLALVVALGACRSKPKADAQPAAVTEPPRDAGPAGASRIVCGGSTCRAGDEVCCDRYGAARCAPAAPIKRPPEPYASIVPEGLFDRCATTDEHTAHAQCDDSEDCAAGETCCAVALPRGALVCTKTPRACIDREPCRPETCRTPGTTCAKSGRCDPVGAEVECHARRCAGASPICCMMLIGDDACVDAETGCAKPAMFRYECDEPSDCGAGLLCCFGGSTKDRPVGGSYCALSCEGGSVACVDDADCRRPDVGYLHVPSIPGWSCSPMNLPPRLKTCSPVPPADAGAPHPRPRSR